MGEQPLVVHVMLDPVPYLIVVKKKLSLHLHDLFLILFDHPLIESVCFR